MDTNMHAFNIENGPSLDRLLDLFKYSYDEAAVIPANFVIAESYTCPLGDPGCAFTILETKDIHIRAISHESGNDYSYELSGWCYVALGERKHASKIENGIYVHSTWRELVSANFSAHYNTRTRKGTITFFVT
jgi:hypothetical protein